MTGNFTFLFLYFPVGVCKFVGFLFTCFFSHSLHIDHDKRLGDPVLRPFLQDVVQFGALSKTLGLVKLTKPQILPSIFKQATIDVPEAGELNFYCTHLDHLDENWRMKQINAIIQSNDEPYILAGGLNSLDESDYSQERWTDIVKYYEEMGKPTPKVEVMKYLKSKDYTDAKDYAGEYESVVMIAKGQSVQGTCKYGTRVDYVLSSPNSPYKFVPGSYLVLSSKGTSDHHIVKVDVVKVLNNNSQENVVTKKQQQQQQHRQKIVKITQSNPSKGIWKTHTG